MGKGKTGEKCEYSQTYAKLERLKQCPTYSPRQTSPHQRKVDIAENALESKGYNPLFGKVYPKDDPQDYQARKLLKGINTCKL